MVPWLVEYAAVLLNRFEVGRDGRTAFERSKGRKARTLGLEFGEAVLWKRRPVGGALAKFSCLWDDGIYLGTRGASGEILAADPQGVLRTRTVQRKPYEERWKPEGLGMVRWVPWADKEDDPEVGERFEVTRMPESEVVEETAKKVDERVPVRFHVKKTDLETHGYSTRCFGCRSILRGTRRQGHSEACRKLLMKAMADNDRVIRSKDRIDEFLARKVEESDLKRIKVEQKDVPVAVLQKEVPVHLPAVRAHSCRILSCRKTVWMKMVAVLNQDQTIQIVAQGGT